jgi:hypothetical protein
VVKRPYIVFDKSNTFNWEYGWDDQSKNYTLLKEDFQREPYGNKYTPNWMSVFANTTVKLKVDVKDLDNKIDSIKDFCIYIKSNNSKIKINNDTTFKLLTYNALNTISSIDVTSDALGSTTTNHLRDSIIPQTKDADIIGKLYISCELPITKKVVLVYVKSKSNSYRDNTAGTKPQEILNILNNQFHNQLLRKWEIAVGDANGIYPTYLDLSNDLAGVSQVVYSSSSAALNYLKYKYDSLTYVNTNINLNIDSLNQNYSLQDDIIINGSPNIKTRFFFITDFDSIPTLSGVGTLGGATFRGRHTGLLTLYGTLIDFPHEFGHFLNLRDLFNNPYPNITTGTTNNIMDYISNRDRFFYFQWYHSNPSKSNIITDDNWVW